MQVQLSKLTALIFVVLTVVQFISKAEGEQTMTEQMFWSIIEKSHASECEEHAENLATELEKLKAEDVVEFEHIFQKFMADAYRWDLWAISYIVNGGSSDDGFEYFRAWLIARGQSIFQASLKNPEAAADKVNPGDIAECEDLIYVPWGVYKSLTGNEFPHSSTNTPDEPSGERWEEEDLENLYPELLEKFS